MSSVVSDDVDDYRPRRSYDQDRQPRESVPEFPAFTVVTDCNQIPVLMDVNLAIQAGRLLMRSRNKAIAALGFQLSNLAHQDNLDEDE